MCSPISRTFADIDFSDQIFLAATEIFVKYAARVKTSRCNVFVFVCACLLRDSFHQKSRGRVGKKFLTPSIRRYQKRYSFNLIGSYFTRRRLIFQSRDIKPIQSR